MLQECDIDSPLNVHYYAELSVYLKIKRRQRISVMKNSVLLMLRKHKVIATTQIYLHHADSSLVGPEYEIYVSAETLSSFLFNYVHELVSTKVNRRFKLSYSVLIPIRLQSQNRTQRQRDNKLL